MKYSEQRNAASDESQAKNTTSGRSSSFEIRSQVPYVNPISALYNGQPVTLIASGDIAGMSPCEKFVDADGRIDWASSDDFVVNDSHVVPLTLNQLRRITQNSNAGTR